MVAYYKISSSEAGTSSQIDFERGKDGNATGFFVHFNGHNGDLSQESLHRHYHFSWPAGSMRRAAMAEVMPLMQDEQGEDFREKALAAVSRLEKSGLVHTFDPELVDIRQFPELTPHISGTNKYERIEFLLNAFGIYPGQWNGSAKSIGHLLRELELGESKLGRDEMGIFLGTTAAVVDVFHSPDPFTKLRLIESFQRWHPVDGIMHGFVRERNNRVSIGEKMLPYESGEEAARRALKEELGLSGHVNLLNQGLIGTEGISRDYPGLRHKKLLYHFVAELTPEQYRPNRLHPTDKDSDGQSPLVYAYAEQDQEKSVYFCWRKHSQ